MKIKYKFLLLISFFCLFSCASNQLYLKDNLENNTFELTIKNQKKADLIIPKFYLEVLDKEICNNQFKVFSNKNENAWFHGIFYSVNIPDYIDSPDRYIVLKEDESITIEISSIKNNYSFENNYDFFYIWYDGYLGKSNKLKINKQLIPIKKE